MSRSPKKRRSPEDGSHQRQSTPSFATSKPAKATLDSGSPSVLRPARSDVYAAWAVCGLLLLAVWLVFGQTRNYEFVDFDDNEYVYENYHLLHGPIAAKVGWALTSNYANNWHPLTWLFHILDYELYGLNAGGHHLTNVLLHALTAILLFLVLRRMTGDLWPSAFVAAAFAIHPLRVESVAWVAERKDVLSGLFFMLTLLAYLGYVRRPFSLVRYLTVMASLALGLMSKPMLVTLPFVLLLLDYWPLRRFSEPSDGSDRRSAARNAARRLVPHERGSFPWHLLVEKIPLFALAAAACLATTLAQGRLVVGFDRLPLSARILNVPLSYVAYLGQFVYPTGLAVLYPHPWPGLSLWKPAAAVLGLTAITIAVLAWRRERPALFVGWFWYLGMLVPVIGLVQVASQARADRYTYLPQIGLGVALAWGVARTIASWPYRRCVCGIGSVLVLAGLIACASRQTAFWRNSTALWNRAIDCTSGNSGAHYRLGCTLAGNGLLDEAIAEYREALKTSPNFAAAHYNLGVLLMRRRQTDEAIVHFRKALRIKPDADACNNLGAALISRKQFDEAIDDFRQAVAIRPDADAHNNLGAALLKGERFDEAISQFLEALKINPASVNAHYNLAVALMSQGRTDEAIEHFRATLKIAPGHGNAHYDLGVALASRGRTDQAIEHYLAALKIEPDRADAHYNLSAVLVSEGRIDEAITHYYRALKIKPDHFAALNNLAWLRATCPKSKFRDGREAVELARRAVRLSGGRDPAILGTLAAAYAEAGQFSEAVQSAQKASDLAMQQNNRASADSLKAKLLLYKAGTPFREPAHSSPRRPVEP